MSKLGETLKRMTEGSIDVIAKVIPEKGKLLVTTAKADDGTTVTVLLTFGNAKTPIGSFVVTPNDEATKGTGIFDKASDYSADIMETFQDMFSKNKITLGFVNN